MHTYIFIYVAELSPCRKGYEKKRKREVHRLSTLFALKIKLCELYYFMYRAVISRINY